MVDSRKASARSGISLRFRNSRLNCRPSCIVQVGIDCPAKEWEAEAVLLHTSHFTLHTPCGSGVLHKTETETSPLLRCSVV